MEDYFDREKKEPTAPIEVPADALSADALQGIIDNFIQREGTDYGASEVGYETKIKQIEKQLLKGDIKIVFDADSESVTLMTKRDWERATAAR